jgi:hypothetical protein
VPLPIIQCSGNDRDIPVRLEADTAHLIGGRTGHLEIVTNTAPAQHSARPALRLASLKPVPVRTQQGLVKNGGELAAVIGRPVWRLVRHGLCGNVVAVAQFDPINPDLGRCSVDQTFHIAIAFGPPSPPIAPQAEYW